MSTLVLAHSGRKGMHWYQRRYQNYDGSLTAEGRIHYGVGAPRGSKASSYGSGKVVKKKNNAKLVSTGEAHVKSYKEGYESYKSAREEGMSRRNARTMGKAAKLDSLANSRQTNLEIRRSTANDNDGKLVTRKEQIRKEANLSREAAIGKIHSKADSLRNNAEIREAGRQAKLYNKDIQKSQKKIVVDAMQKSNGTMKDYEKHLNKNISDFQNDNQHYQYLKKRGRIVDDQPEKSNSKTKTNYGSSSILDKANRNDLQNTRQDADRFIEGSNRLRQVGRKKTDLSQYSDAELQKIVNRQQLEQRYNQLNPDKIDKGSAIMRESLQTAGAAAGLYLTYKTLKKM